MAILHRSGVAAVLLALLAVGGCTAPWEMDGRAASGRADVRTERYVCADGTTLDVRFSEAEGTATVRTIVGAEPLVLPAQPSGSGFLYATPRHSLQGKGREAHWTVGRSVPVRCAAG